MPRCRLVRGPGLGEHTTCPVQCRWDHSRQPQAALRYAQRQSSVERAATHGQLATTHGPSAFGECFAAPPVGVIAMQRQSPPPSQGPGGHRQSMALGQLNRRATPKSDAMAPQAPPPLPLLPKDAATSSRRPPRRRHGNRHRDQGRCAGQGQGKGAARWGAGTGWSGQPMAPPSPPPPRPSSSLSTIRNPSPTHPHALCRRRPPPSPAPRHATSRHVTPQRPCQWWCCCRKVCSFAPSWSLASFASSSRTTFSIRLS